MDREVLWRERKDRNEMKKQQTTAHEIRKSQQHSTCMRCVCVCVVQQIHLYGGETTSAVNKNCIRGAAAAVCSEHNLPPRPSFFTPLSFFTPPLVLYPPLLGTHSSTLPTVMNLSDAVLWIIRGTTLLFGEKLAVSAANCCRNHCHTWSDLSHTHTH